MSSSLKRYVRQLHRNLAPIMLLPLLLSLTTGVLFQLAVIAGKESDFIWLLALHRGNFGSINLENVYTFLNALGLLFLIVTGIIMWWQTTRRRRNNSV
ncbi:PepSY domain-containing protein [Oscillatoria salina]|uniref:PepSY domain-containing protein n=1 Tax=Oscillatoria salina TaxID=331517 RepID=UPI001CC9A010|nr:PepSY domain-containing protein [Oscillatoria salina]